MWSVVGPSTTVSAAATAPPNLRPLLASVGGLVGIPVSAASYVAALSASILVTSVAGTACSLPGASLACRQWLVARCDLLNEVECCLRIYVFSGMDRVQSPASTDPLVGFLNVVVVVADQLHSVDHCCWLLTWLLSLQQGT